MATIQNSQITQLIRDYINNSQTIDSIELANLINQGLAPSQQLQSSTILSTGLYKRFTDFDRVDSKVEIVTTGVWTGDVGTLTSFFTSSTQLAQSGDYYYNVYNSEPGNNDSEVQFALAYGHVNGSGSVSLDIDDTSTLVTKATYKQYVSTLLDNADEKFEFEDGSGDPQESNDIFVINLSRSRFREKLDSGNWSLNISGSNGLFTFVDNSGKKFGDTLGSAGRVFKVVSGSLNLGTENDVTVNTTTASNGEGYGLFYPDRGIIILNPTAIGDTIGEVTFSTGSGHSETANVSGSLVTTHNTQNHSRLFSAIQLGEDFQARRTENVQTQHYFARATNREFNYSNNPTYTNQDGTFVEGSFETDPKTYITTVGLYNDSNELIAVAKTSQPIPKSYEREIVLKIKLSF